MAEATITSRAPAKVQKSSTSTTEDLEKQERDLRNHQNSMRDTFYLSMMALWIIVIPCLVASMIFLNFIPVAAGTAVSIGLVVWIKKSQS